MRQLSRTLLAVSLACIVASPVMAQGRGFRGGRGGRGPDANFVKDRNDFHFLLEHHDQIRREVTLRDNGVETITESDDAEVAAKIQKHVTAMYERVEHNRPVRMRDPLFAEIFQYSSQVKMELSNTPNGVRVVETSDDPYVVKLIQSHAKVVSAFVEHGFEEAHRTHAIPGKSEDGADPDGGSVKLHDMNDMQEMVFVEFDRIYIPALALTNQKKPAAAGALERLSESWDKRFVVHFHEMFEGDSRWPRDVSRIAQCIALAQNELGAGESLKAHEELEPIRDILMNARRRNNVDYALDSLSQFHATMEAVVKPAMQLDTNSLDQAQIDSFSQLAEQAEREWKLVEQTKFDFSMLGKDDQRGKQFPGMLRAERDAIKRLQNALATQDKESILKAARGLKPPFAKVYMFFGDFPKQVPANR